MEERTTQPYFFVSNSKEAGMVSDAGYQAFVCGGLSDGEIRNLASTVALDDTTAVVILDAVAERKVIKACREVRARCRPTIKKDAVQALREGGDAAVRFFKHEAEEAIRNRDHDRETANMSFLASLGIHDSEESVTELVSGAADLEKIPTGLSCVDTMLDGGLPKGSLVTMGALSSLGKTTLCNQIGCTVARSGKNVLFVTCEQSRYELHSMGISRLIAEQSGGRFKVSRAEIQSGTRRNGWFGPLREAFDEAYTTYTNEIALHMHIMECDEQPSGREIRKATEALAAVYGGVDLVIVDYLQLLKAENPRMDERLAVNENVSILRKLARDLNVCVLLISALRRSSMGEGVTQSAFRESSGIEYSSDLMLGLQPRGMGDRLNETSSTEQNRTANGILDGWRDASEKPTELKVLKNRAGSVPTVGAPLIFDAGCSRFYPDDGSCNPYQGSQKARLKKKR